MMFSGKAYAFVEFCELGSLLKYLRTQQNLDKPSSAELCQWSREIVNGMAFLAAKRIIHADLATRNVLLTSDKTAKISDFGLSRKLYNYSQYVKKSKEPLPWRWMAPESLQQMEFTEKTDVWAFGVTLWEIYSFGNTPYPELSWDKNFVARLLDGFRLSEPATCQDWIYSVMLKCWCTDANQRPTFTELKEEFRNFSGTYVDLGSG